MCTVTYLPLENDSFILTSNRDESPMRKTIPPKKYIENGVELIYPKDELAGGTWIGLSEKDRLVCLLNGGFEKHKRNTYYKMSRGVVVKNILSVDDPVSYINEFDFDNKKNDDDILIKTNKISVLIDKISLGLINGSKIDYVNELIGSSFKVTNPKSSSSCGCGTSFSL